MKKIFEFKCVSCGEAHEAYINFDQISHIEKDMKCQLCGGKLRRVYSFGMGQFKGTGFTRRITK